MKARQKEDFFEYESGTIAEPTLCVGAVESKVLEGWSWGGGRKRSREMLHLLVGKVLVDEIGSGAVCRCAI